MALPTITLSDTSREKIRAALVPARHALFWAEWVFRLLFVGPAVWLCLALALSSHFSFESLANDTLEVIASMERSPAPPADGFIMMGKCKDAVPSAPRELQKASVLCKTPGWEQMPIKKAASTVSHELWVFYAVGALLTFAFSLIMGWFHKSRAAFLGALHDNRPGIRLVRSGTGATK